jgi:branched-chain amino acid transport system ATP-binding protein
MTRSPRSTEGGADPDTPAPRPLDPALAQTRQSPSRHGWTGAGHTAADQPAGTIFAMDHCSVVFGGLTAVNDVSFMVERGELVGLIGPNGAGKTTIFNLITGVYSPTAGRIVFDGRQIAGPREPRRFDFLRTRSRRSGITAMGKRDIARTGICRTFQNIRLFGGLTVLENVLIATNFRRPESLAAATFRSAYYYETEAAARDTAMGLLAALKLESYADLVSKNLPYGAQRRLEIARALGARPQLLLLDEPAAGMNPQESHELMEMIRWVRETFGLTILLIEHDMKVVMGVCERVLVLVNGALLADDSPERIRANPRVVAAYLGEPD